MFSRFKFGALAGAVGAVLTVIATAPTTSAATPTPGVSAGKTALAGATVNHIDVSQIKDFSGWNVEYWGPGYASGTLDASIAANRDISHVVPLRVRETVAAIGANEPKGAAVSPSAVGFLCTLYVGATYHNSYGRLSASTAQTCTGAFLDQWTAGQFDRSSWTGWRTYGPVITSESTYGETLDTDFWVECEEGGGTYDYALSAIPWATSSEDGTTHSGPLERGGKGRYACGT